MSIAVGHAVAHGVARQQTAVAVAVGIDEAAAGHAQHAVVILGNGAGILTGGAQLGGRKYLQPAVVLADGQNALVAAALHPHQQELVGHIDGKHLFAVDGLNLRAAVVQAGLVDDDPLPAVGQRLGILLQPGLHGIRIDFIIQLVEGLPGSLFRILLLHHGDLRDGVLRLLGLFGLLRLNRIRRFLLLAPGRLHAVHIDEGLGATVHDSGNHVRGDNRRRQPFVAQGIHGRLDIGGPPFGHKRVVCVDAEEIAQLQPQQAGQYYSQGFQRIAPSGFPCCRGADRRPAAPVFGQTGAGTLAAE